MSVDISKYTKLIFKRRDLTLDIIADFEKFGGWAILYPPRNEDKNAQILDIYDKLTQLINIDVELKDLEDPTKSIMADKDTPGLVKVGDGLVIAEDGTLSIDINKVITNADIVNEEEAIRDIVDVLDNGFPPPPPPETEPPEPTLPQIDEEALYKL